jgi:hypothetical protein
MLKFHCSIVSQKLREKVEQKVREKVEQKLLKI